MAYLCLSIDCQFDDIQRCPSIIFHPHRSTKESCFACGIMLRRVPTEIGIVELEFILRRYSMTNAKYSNHPVDEKPA